jgi:hypothetical protein
MTALSGLGESNIRHHARSRRQSELDRVLTFPPQHALWEHLSFASTSSSDNFLGKETFAFRIAMYSYPFL